MRRSLLLLLPLLALALIAAGCGTDDPASPPSTSSESTLDDAGSFDLAETTPLLSEDEEEDFDASVRSYEIVVENLTPNTGDGGAQVFSPPVIATHDRSVRLFRVGHRASEALAGLAEDAINGPVIDLLSSAPGTHEVVAGDGVIPPGASARYEIRGTRRMHRLSMAFMLVNTNDGFSGLSGVRLPRHGQRSFLVRAYDAGSEANTELQSDIPGPCCGSPGEGTPTSGRILPHRGILGVGDLDPAKWGWDGPVARVTVRVLEPMWEITLTNLTPDTGDGGAQVFSPPVIATHRGRSAIFRPGHRASEALAGLAEDALNGPLVESLQSRRGVFQVVEGDDVVPPGASASYRVEGNRRATRLSMAFMLVNTNDGFSGVSGMRLPRSGRKTWHLSAYDAGSEANTELRSDIPGPCCGSPGAGTPTHERIHAHPGIRGVGDLDPAKWGWDGPVAELSIVRVR